METSVDDFTTALPVAAVGSTVRYSQKPGGHRPKHTVVFLEERARAQTVQRDFENQAGSKGHAQESEERKDEQMSLLLDVFPETQQKKVGSHHSDICYRLIDANIGCWA